MRIEIIRSKEDKDEILTYLWNALYPLFKETNGKIMVYMSNDLGNSGHSRGMVIYIEGLKKSEVKIIQLKDINPSRRNLEEEF